MSVRMRHTHGHTRNRRSHHALGETVIVTDKKSGALRLPHRLDETTGMYRGKLIVPERKKDLKADAKRKHEHKHEHSEGVKEPMHIEKQAIESMKEEKKGGGTLGRIVKQTKVRPKARSGNA